MGALADPSFAPHAGHAARLVRHHLYCCNAQGESRPVSWHQKDTRVQTMAAYSSLSSGAHTPEHTLDCFMRVLPYSNKSKKYVKPRGQGTRTEVGSVLKHSLTCTLSMPQPHLQVQLLHQGLTDPLAASPTDAPMGTCIAHTSPSCCATLHAAAVITSATERSTMSPAPSQNGKAMQGLEGHPTGCA